MKTIGVVSIILGVLGLLTQWFSLSMFAMMKDSETLSSALSMNAESSTFEPIFYSMSAICVICFLLLTFCGIQFVQLKTRILPLFVGLMIFEIVYTVLAFILPMILGSKEPEQMVAMMMPMITANMGMGWQFKILFPLWAPFVAIYLAKKIKSPDIHDENSSRDRTQITLPKPLN